MKTSVEMKVGAVEEQKKSLEAELRATDLRIKLADDTIAGVPLSEGWIQTLKSMNELEEESKRHAAGAADLHKKADKYYESEKLGN